LYTLLLSFHSLIRWLVLLTGGIAVIRAAMGWLNGLEWAALDNRLGLGFMVSVDVQTILGLSLYLFLSPITESAFEDFSSAMDNDEIRFFAFDHIFLMILVLLLVHAGRIVPRRTADAVQKHKKAFIIFAIAMAAILVAVPWGRPLLRLG